MLAIITGAASGIGRDVAHRLAADARRNESSPKLALLDRDTEGLARVVSELGATQARAVEVDLADAASVQTAAHEALDWLGGLDALISNAGVILPGPLAELSLEDWDAAFAINTRAAWLLATHCHDALAASHAPGGGSMVITASLAATAASGNMGAYSPSKAAARMLSFQLAREWGPEGIRVNCVSPGSTVTAMTEAIFDDPQRKAERAAGIPLGRVGEADDVADVICFLTGADARFVTGADINVDGGWSVSLVPGGVGVAQER